MSNHENEKFDELVNEQREELEYQDHLVGGEICQGGQCRYCEEEADDDQAEEDDIFGGIHPDTPALEHFQPNEFFTEGEA